MKWYVLMVFLLLPLVSTAAEFNAGFVQGLWYSEETFFVDDTVRVYVAIRNNTGSDLTGTVEFFDNEERIGRSTVSALDGRIIESWVDWEPTFGEHRLSASIAQIELHTVGERTEAVEVRSSLAEDIVFIDYDTDDDGIGNAADRDDDGDGISDTVEEKNGTDPLIYDEPPAEPEETAGTEDETDETENEHGSTGRVGLEQYLTPSRADQLLESITQETQAMKQRLDAYRASRNVEQSDETDVESDEVAVNDDGFGEITRTGHAPAEEELEREPEGTPEGFIGDLFGFIGAIFSGIYSGILAVLSFFLGHPILVQVALLFTILYILYRIAKRFGSRPQ